MPTVWMALKKSLNCKSEDSCGVIKREESHSARGVKKSAAAAASSLRRLGCSLSIASLRDVIHSQYGSSRRQEHGAAAAAAASGCGSPRSIASNDVLNPVTHEVMLAAGPAARCELRISTPGRSAWAGGGVPFPHSPLLLRCSTTPVSLRKSPPVMSPLHGDDEDAEAPSPAPARASCEVGVRCHRCGDRFANHDALESHHLSNHSGKHHHASRLQDKLCTVSSFMAPVRFLQSLSWWKAIRRGGWWRSSARPGGQSPRTRWAASRGSSR